MILSSKRFRRNFALGPTIIFLVRWILTLAVGTVKVFVLGSTTVAAVPVASTSVVGVVTVSVANETHDFAITFALAVFALAVWVEAFALVTGVLRTMQKTGA